MIKFLINYNSFVVGESRYRWEAPADLAYRLERRALSMVSCFGTGCLVLHAAGDYIYQITYYY